MLTSAEREQYTIMQNNYYAWYQSTCEVFGQFDENTDVNYYLNQTMVANYVRYSLSLHICIYHVYTIYFTY